MYLLLSVYACARVSMHDLVEQGTAVQAKREVRWSGMQGDGARDDLD